MKYLIILLVAMLLASCTKQSPPSCWECERSHLVYKDTVTVCGDYPEFDMENMISVKCERK